MCFVVSGTGDRESRFSAQDRHRGGWEIQPRDPIIVDFHHALVEHINCERFENSRLKQALGRCACATK